MAELLISGSKPKKGSIQISGAKNAVLPLMAACLLTDKDVVLENVPEITEVDKMKKQLEAYGVKIGVRRSPLVLNAANATFEPKRGYKPENTTRGGFTALGPLLARFWTARIHQPVGCRIDQAGRPVDFHLNALVEMGAEKVPDHNLIFLKAEGGLHGENIHFPRISVGATENIMMAACLAEGKTTITNAAVEPEVIDLVDMLKKMGAKIEVDEPRNKITIHGQRRLLFGTTHTVIPDRIEAGSYAIAAAIAGGSLLLKMKRNKNTESMFSVVVEKLKKAGVRATWQRDGLLVKERRSCDQIRKVDITAGPYPKFPTDLLPQWVTFMTQAQGESRIEDTIYNNRFMHVRYLEEMGASFDKLSDNILIVHGGANLQGKHVYAEDLRGGFALILAGMAAKGTTVVKTFEHVERGYENIKEKLKQCGAILEEWSPTPKGFYGGPQY